MKIMYYFLIKLFKDVIPYILFTTYCFGGGCLWHHYFPAKEVSVFLDILTDIVLFSIVSILFLAVLNYNIEIFGPVLRSRWKEAVEMSIIDKSVEDSDSLLRESSNSGDDFLRGSRESNQ